MIKPAVLPLAALACGVLAPQAGFAASHRRLWNNATDATFELKVLPRKGQAEVGNLHCWNQAHVILGEDSVQAPDRVATLGPNAAAEITFTTTNGQFYHQFSLSQKGQPGFRVVFQADASWLRGKTAKHPLSLGVVEATLPPGVKLDQVLDPAGLLTGVVTLKAPFVAVPRPASVPVVPGTLPISLFCWTETTGWDLGLEALPGAGTAQLVGAAGAGKELAEIKGSAEGASLEVGLNRLLLTTGKDGLFERTLRLNNRFYYRTGPRNNPSLANHLVNWYRVRITWKNGQAPAATLLEQMSQAERAQVAGGRPLGDGWLSPDLSRFGKNHRLELLSHESDQLQRQHGQGDAEYDPDEAVLEEQPPR